MGKSTLLASLSSVRHNLCTQNIQAGQKPLQALILASQNYNYRNTLLLMGHSPRQCILSRMWWLLTTTTLQSLKPFCIAAPIVPLPQWSYHKIMQCCNLCTPNGICIIFYYEELHLKRWYWLLKCLQMHSASTYHFLSSLGCLSGW